MMDVIKLLREMKIPFECDSALPSFQYLDLCDSAIEDTICTFIESPEYLEDIKSADRVVLTNKQTSESAFKYPHVIVESPRTIFYLLHNHLYSNHREDYRRKTFATTIGSNCDISPLAYISDVNVSIGDHVTIEEFASIKANTTIRDNVIIRSGVSVGSVNLAYERIDGNLITIEHAGGVLIDNDVEILSNTSVGRAVFPWNDTTIGEGTKIDILVSIAHGVKIGKNTIIAGGTITGGSMTIGDDVWLSIGSIYKPKVHIADHAKVSMGAVVMKDVAEGDRVSGRFGTIVLSNSSD
jgi:UDP-3-O-[3-hydroxymyristoyl] glucosamine N-acyltransferase